MRDRISTTNDQRRGNIKFVSDKQIIFYDVNLAPNRVGPQFLKQLFVKINCRDLVAHITQRDGLNSITGAKIPRDSSVDVSNSGVCKFLLLTAIHSANIPHHPGVEFAQVVIVVSLCCAHVAYSMVEPSQCTNQNPGRKIRTSLAYQR